MDNSTNGGTDKRNWREKLGIGTNGLPKPADGAKPSGEATVAVSSASPAPGAAKLAPRPQPVARPAPMAPRAPAKPAAPPPAAAPQAPVAAKPVPVAAPRPVMPMPAPAGAATSPEGLANRLKAQREAAEKLAEQRIQMARQRAEAARQDSAAPAVGGASRPKFSFVDEEAKASQAKAAAAQIVPPPLSTNLPPPLVRTAPPRPTLGADGARPVLSPRPAADYQPPSPPSYAPRQPGYTPPYRPIDPVTGYAPPAAGSRSYVPPLAQPRLPPTLPPADDQDQEFGYAPPVRQQRPVRPGQPMVPRQPQSAYAEGDDIFEQPVRRSRRPSADEYAQAYQDSAGGYEEDHEQSGSPWWILVSALVLLAAAVGGYLFYSNYVSKPVASIPAADTPVVTAPEQPAKVDPEQSQATQQPAASQPAVAKPSKKQIYDRIVGDKEVLGDAQLMPTEEIPVQPETGTQAVVPAGEASPDGTAPPGTVDQGAGDTAPLPVPPPPGTNGQQGQLEQPDAQTEIANVTPAANESEAANLPVEGLKTTTEAAATEAADSGVAVDDVVPTPSEKMATIKGTEPTPTVDQVPQVPGTAPAVAKAEDTATAPLSAAQPSTSQSAAAPATTEAQVPAAQQPPAEAQPIDDSAGANEVTDAPPVKPVKAASKPKPARKAASQANLDNLGVKPVVLVPPNAPGAAPAVAEDGLYGNLPASNAVAEAPAAAQPKRRTLSDLFKQRSASSEPAVSTQPAVTQQQQQTQVSAVQPRPAEPTVRSAAPVGNGYVVQLASFRSRAEADQEFARVRSKYGTVVNGMAPVVTESSIGGSTRYRLGLGPVDSRATASQVCSRLISAGERDCVVTRQ